MVPQEGFLEAPVAGIRPEDTDVYDAGVCDLAARRRRRTVVLVDDDE